MMFMDFATGLHRRSRVDLICLLVPPFGGMFSWLPTLSIVNSEPKNVWHSIRANSTRPLTRHCKATEDDLKLVVVADAV
jgi:hypothetical protein